MSPPPTWVPHKGGGIIKQHTSVLIVLNPFEDERCQNDTSPIQSPTQISEFGSILIVLYGYTRDSD